MSPDPPAGEPSPPSYRTSGRSAVVHLRGDLETARAGEVWSELRRATSGQDLASVDLDVSLAQSMDGAIAALLVELRGELCARGVRAEITGASERIQPLIDLYAQRREEPAAPRRPLGLVERVGQAAEEVASGVAAIISFVGELAWTTRRLVRRPRLAHLREVPRLVEKAGADAIPIVLLINFLVGFVMAYQAARQLKLFGANV